MSIKKGVSDVEDRKYRHKDKQKIVGLFPTNVELTRIKNSLLLKKKHSPLDILDFVSELHFEKVKDAYYVIGLEIKTSSHEISVLCIDNDYYDPLTIFLNERLFMPIVKLNIEELLAFYHRHSRVPKLADLSAWTSHRREPD